MITNIEIENFRGFKHLKVEGLGRVNLIIGRNDCGKTSFMGAAAFARAPEWLATYARVMGHMTLKPTDFERVWRPLFRGGNPDPAPKVSSTYSDGVVETVSLGMTTGGRGAVGKLPITLQLAIGEEIFSAVYQRQDEDIEFVSSSLQPQTITWWSMPYPDTDEELLSMLVQIFRQGRLQEVSEAIRIINNEVDRIELAGNAIYVVLRNHLLPLSVSVLGDGARRLLEFGAASTLATDGIFIDEIENGFHHTTLPSVWKLLQSAKVDQIFATTHRDENIRVACEVFQAAGDDGLRIVRIDRDGDTHRAVVYTPEVAMAAMDSNMEIRG